MVADRGANARLSADDLPPRLEADAVLVSGYVLFHPGSQSAALAALERAQGAVLSWAGRSSIARSDRVDRPVDPTGAGDACDGGLVAALAGGASEEEPFVGRATPAEQWSWPRRPGLS